MIYSIVVTFIALWLLGLIATYTIGGLVQVLLAVAIVVTLLRFIGTRSSS